MRPETSATWRFVRHEPSPWSERHASLPGAGPETFRQSEGAARRAASIARGQFAGKVHSNYAPRGRGFESCRARQSTVLNQALVDLAAGAYFFRSVNVGIVRNTVRAYPIGRSQQVPQFRARVVGGDCGARMSARGRALAPAANRTARTIIGCLAQYASRDSSMPLSGSSLASGTTLPVAIGQPFSSRDPINLL